MSTNTEPTTNTGTSTNTEMVANTETGANTETALIRRAGDRALLVCPTTHDELPETVHRLREASLPGIEDLLPAAETVLVSLRPDAVQIVVEQQLRHLLAAPAAGQRVAEEGSDAVVIPVRYDGEDLTDVAAILGTTVEEVIEAHTRRTWRCRFIGFTAGFGYLEPDTPSPDTPSPDTPSPDTPSLTLPRRAQSRTAVPAGAVALADGYSAVYPRRAPGGWQLIGTTDLAMFDLNRPRPALLSPGTRVRFVRADRR